MSLAYSIPSPSGRPPSSGGGGNISQRLSTHRSSLKSGSSALNRTIPINPKYVHVRSSIQTGKHINNLKPKLDRSAELFERVSSKTLDSWMSEAQRNEEESIFQLEEEQHNTITPTSATHITPRSAVSSSRISSASSSSDSSFASTESSTSASSRQAEHPVNERTASRLPPFILCDCRLAEEFDAVHIEGSISYPSACVRRDQFPDLMYLACKRQGRPLIVYDGDAGKLGVDTANLLCQKLFPNVYLLNGGLKSFSEKFPNRVVDSQSADDSSTVLQSNSAISNQAVNKVHVKATEKNHVKGGRK